MTPDQLFDYVDGYARAAEAAGKGTTYPTFREIGRKFRVRFDEIEQACYDWDSSKGYMQPIVAIKSGNLVGSIGRAGDKQVEAYR